MTDSHSRAPALEQEDEAIPDTQAREAAEFGDPEEASQQADEGPPKDHPLSRRSLKGLKRLLQEEEAEAAAQGINLGATHPTKMEIGRRERYLASRKSGAKTQLSTLHNASRLLIIDIEATCYDPTPPEADMDIIEIGGVLLDGKSLEILKEIQLYTKPTHTEVGEFCTELTGITPEMVAEAPSFVERMADLGRFIEENRVDVWASFGRYDFNKIAGQSLRDGAVNPLADIPHVNLKKVVGLELGYGKYAPGLNFVIDLIGLTRQGRQHSGIDDAKNIASVLRAIVDGRHLADDINISEDDRPRARRPRM